MFVVQRRYHTHTPGPMAHQRILTYFVRESNTVWLASSSTKFDSITQENVLLVVFSETTESRPVKNWRLTVHWSFHLQWMLSWHKESNIIFLSLSLSLSLSNPFLFACILKPEALLPAKGLRRLASAQLSSKFSHHHLCTVSNILAFNKHNSLPLVKIRTFISFYYRAAC